jgi:transposase
MARKNYSEEFRRQAVDLYESTPGATVRAIAADLGVERGTLRHWLDLYGTGKKTAADGTATRSPLKPGADPARPAGSEVIEGLSPQEQIARLQAQVAALRAETTKLTSEREILRQAAKYFAGETKLVSRFQFVEDHRDAYEVKRLCELVEVERSSYYAWRDAAPTRAARVASDQQLAGRIRAVHDGDPTVGAPRMTAELNDQLDENGRPGERVNPSGSLG